MDRLVRMKVIAVIVIMLLWIVSVFTFANWRMSATMGRKLAINVSKDLIFQLYLKFSGLGVLGWVCLLMASAA